MLIITGNPIGVCNSYHDLEQALYQAISAVVVNHPTSPPGYLRGQRKQRKDLLKKLPYPKPIASIMPDSTKDAVSKHMYEAELSKGIAVPLGEIEPSKETEEEIFPEASKDSAQHNDIFTPPEAAQRTGKTKPERKFFVTENPDVQARPEEEQPGKQEDEQMPGQEIEPGMEQEAEEQLQEPEGDDKDYGVRKMREFMQECREYLGDIKMYNSVMPIALACKALKHSLRFPTTFVGSTDNAHYMKGTLTSMISKSLKHQSRAINFKEMQSKEHALIGSDAEDAAEAGGSCEEEGAAKSAGTGGYTQDSAQRPAQGYNGCSGADRGGKDPRRKA